jgi:nicotinamide mononucleotide transporter
MVGVTKTAFELLGEPVSWSELLGFITGVACVALAVARRISNFPVGIANNVFFGVLFLDSRLYADASLQAVYIVLGVMGWWVWWRGPELELRAERSSAGLLVSTAGGVLLATLVLHPILEVAHGAAPWWDALTTSMSLGAQFLLNLKRLENWYVWIAVDLIYVPLYLSRDLNLTALTYVVFLGLCFMGWRQWSATVSS